MVNSQNLNWKLRYKLQDRNNVNLTNYLKRKVDSTHRKNGDSS